VRRGVGSEIQAGKSLDGLKGENSDQDVVIAIIRKAIEAPLRQIGNFRRGRFRLLRARSAKATTRPLASTHRPKIWRHVKFRPVNRPGQGCPHRPAGCSFRVAGLLIPRKP